MEILCSDQRLWYLACHLHLSHMLHMLPAGNPADINWKAVFTHRARQDGMWWLGRQASLMLCGSCQTLFWDEFPHPCPTIEHVSPAVFLQLFPL